MIQEFTNIALVSALFLTMVAPNLFVAGDLVTEDGADWWANVFLIESFFTTLSFAMSILFALFYLLYVNEMVNLDELVRWNDLVGMWTLAPTFLYFIGIFGWIFSILIFCHANGTPLLISFINCGMLGVVICLFQYYLIRHVQALYRAKYEVAVGKFRIGMDVADYMKSKSHGMTARKASNAGATAAAAAEAAEAAAGGGN